MRLSISQTGKTDKNTGTAKAKTPSHSEIFRSTLKSDKKWTPEQNLRRPTQKQSDLEDPFGNQEGPIIGNFNQEKNDDLGLGDLDIFKDDNPKTASQKNLGFQQVGLSGQPHRKSLQVKPVSLLKPNALRQNQLKPPGLLKVGQNQPISPISQPSKPPAQNTKNLTIHPIDFTGDDESEIDPF